jgi:hypothetical protein
MVRLVIVISISAFAIIKFFPVEPGDDGPVTAVANVREVMGETSPRFHARLVAGADCSELIALRDTYDPDSVHVGRMNEELRAIGCDSPSSTRTR